MSTDVHVSETVSQSCKPKSYFRIQVLLLHTLPPAIYVRSRDSRALAVITNNSTIGATPSDPWRLHIPVMIERCEDARLQPKRCNTAQDQAGQNVCKIDRQRGSFRTISLRKPRRDSLVFVSETCVSGARGTSSRW